MIDDVSENIRNEQHADAMPGPDPLTPCNGCGKEYRVSEFRQNGQISNDPEEPVLCADCLDEPTGVKSVDERRENNQHLSRFHGGGDG